MRNRIRRWVAGVVWAGFALGILGCGEDPVAPSSSPSLLENGDFEAAGAGGLPASWTAQNRDVFSAFSWPDDIRHAGARSASIEVLPGALANRVYMWSQDVTDGFNVGDTLDLGAWVRTDGLVRSAVVFLRCFGLDGVAQLCFATSETSFDLVGTLDWTEVSVPVVVAEGTIEIRVSAAVTGDNVGGRVWFDDISLRRR